MQWSLSNCVLTAHGNSPHTPALRVGTVTCFCEGIGSLGAILDGGLPHSMSSITPSQLFPPHLLPPAKRKPWSRMALGTASPASLCPTPDQLIGGRGTHLPSTPCGWAPGAVALGRGLLLAFLGFIV